MELVVILGSEVQVVNMINWFKNLCSYPETTVVQKKVSVERTEHVMDTVYQSLDTIKVYANVIVDGVEKSYLVHKMLNVPQPYSFVLNTIDSKIIYTSKNSGYYAHPFDKTQYKGQIDLTFKNIRSPSILYKNYVDQLTSKPFGLTIVETIRPSMSMPDPLNTLDERTFTVPWSDVKKIYMELESKNYRFEVVDIRLKIIEG